MNRLDESSLRWRSNIIMTSWVMKICTYGHGKVFVWWLISLMKKRKFCVVSIHIVRYTVTILIFHKSMTFPLQISSSISKLMDEIDWVVEEDRDGELQIISTLFSQLNKMFCTFSRIYQLSRFSHIGVCIWPVRKAKMGCGMAASNGQKACNVFPWGLLDAYQRFVHVLHLQWLTM